MKLDTIIEKMRDIFVEDEIFNLRVSPIERIVYGFVGLVLVGVATALVSLVIMKK